jgi:hypothetical protein
VHGGSGSDSISDRSGNADPTPDAAPPAKAGRWRRRALVALAVVAVLAVAVRALLPWAIARTIESQAQSQLALPVRVANIDLWLARGAIAIEELVVGRVAVAPTGTARPPDPDDALLRLARLYVHLDWAALLGRRVHLRELTLEAPQLRFERDAEGRIEPLGPPAAEPETEPEPEPDAVESTEPWSFALDRFELRELAVEIADQATQRTPVEIALARLSLTDIAIGGSDLALGGVELENPVLHIDRDFALGGGGGGEATAPTPPSDQTRPPDAAPPPEQGSEASAALAYQIERIHIADADFTLRTDSGPIEISLRLEAEQVNARSGVVFPIDLTLGIEDGRLALQGKLGLNPLAYDGRVAWNDLRLPPLGVALRPELAGWVRSCEADGDFALTFRAAREGDAAPGLRLEGTAKIRELLLADPSSEEVSVGWKELEIVAREVVVPLPEEGAEARATRVSLERVRLVAPDILYTMPAPSLDELLGAGGEPEPEGEAKPEPEPGAAPLELVVDAFDLDGARIRLRDETLSPPVETTLRDLKLAVREAGLPEPHAKSVRATGIIRESATFSLDGGLGKGSGDLKLSVDRLPLPPFDPYAEKGGYELTRGQASLETKLRMRGARTDVENRLVLHRLALSSRDPGAFEKTFGMPLDLALALLRDTSGDISLAIPLVVDEAGARTSLATIVRGALRQALVGALSSPLKLVGAVLPTGGGGEATLEPIAAVPGQAALAAGAEERLDALARLLGERPVLGLRLRGRVGPADRSLVAEQILAERAAAGEDWPTVEGEGFFARRRLAEALEARARGESAALSPEDEALLARTAAAVKVPAERMQALARQRAEAARERIAAARGIDVRRLQIGDAAGEGDPAVLLEFAAVDGGA